MVWYTPSGVRNANAQYRIQYRLPVVSGGGEAGSDIAGAESDSSDEDGPRGGAVSQSNLQQIALGRARAQWLHQYLTLKRGLQAEPMGLGEIADPRAHHRCFVRELVLLLQRRT